MADQSKLEQMLEKFAITQWGMPFKMRYLRPENESACLPRPDVGYIVRRRSSRSDLRALVRTVVLRQATSGAAAPWFPVGGGLSLMASSCSDARGRSI